MRTRTALIELLKAEQEWRRFFKACCEMSSYRLRSQTWQFRDELQDRGFEFEDEEIEDGLFDLARVILPQSPAAQWDSEWAAALTSQALRCMKEHYVEGADLSSLGLWEDRMNAVAMA